MKAAVRDRYGPPEVLRIADVQTPVPGEREVLVRVHVTTVNRTDCGFRSGKPLVVRFFAGLARPKRPILGTEFAGTVEAVGPGATPFSVGDRVFGFSEWRFGAHAEYLTMRADGAIATMPADASFEEIAAATEGSHYALSMIDGAKVRTGQRVLVYGATGAIGSAAVQLLKDRGAHVTAVCDGAHVDLVRSLGADRVIDRTAEDFTADGQTYDAVVDAVGKTSFFRCRRIMKPSGIFVSSDLGPWGMNPVLGIVTPLIPGRRAKMPFPPRHSKARVQRFGAMFEAGTFRPVIDRRYPLDRIVDAYRYVETGQKIGNVLIDVAGPEAAAE